MRASKAISVRIKRHDVEYKVVVCKGSTAGELAKTFRQIGLIEARGQMGRIGRRACVLLDEGFARAHPRFVESLQKIFPRKDNLYIKIAGAETSKSLVVAGKILGEMIKKGFTRNDLCIAVGGGVVGDLGGFVASLYHRGMDVVHIPTTLLAMVDSSIGGKTAVNHPDGKNLIGTFHQPKAVIAILDFVSSLPHFDFLSGLGEVFKYAVGFSPSLFKYLEANAAGVLSREPAVLTKILLESVAIKAAVVARDERESGVSALHLDRNDRFADRRLLNLGHTMGHGIEKAYSLPHGMAVAIGVTLAAKLSARVKLCPQQCYHDVMRLAHRLSLLTEMDLDWKLRELLPYVKKDKKIVGDKLQFVCLKRVGHAFVKPIRFEDLKLLEA